MQSEYNEKITVKYPPCKLPQTCINYDYDPCESSDDITEKDLAVLLKEEEAKLRDAELREAELREAKLREAKLREAELREAKLREARERAEAERLNREQELFDERKDLNESVKAAKKKCKKVTKNPFFSSRLELSTCLPPPPPTPPPQFFPTFDEDKCKGKLPEPKRKKKCKKIKADDNNLMINVEEGPECEADETRTCINLTEPETETEETPEPDDRDYVEEWRRKCRKISKRPPCRKRSSEISSGFQARQIPARQRDLPPTSPLEMPEVERQIWLSCKNDCQTDCARNNCKMACIKKKCKRKRKSSESTSND